MQWVGNVRLKGLSRLLTPLAHLSDSAGSATWG